MENLKFIFFEGCPNAQEMKMSLINLGLKFEEIEQNALPDGNPFKDYSSPTVIKNDRIIFGGHAEGGGCSLNLPDLEQLKKLLI